MTVTFESSEVVVPTSIMYVAVARFSFFYWLWYLHQCKIPELQNNFRPKPQQHMGVFTFKARAAQDAGKVDGAVREMLKRGADATLDWAQQLGQFVDGRLEPLRKLKTIIE